MPEASTDTPVTAHAPPSHNLSGFYRPPLIIDVVTRPVQSLLVGISERSKTQLKDFITSCVRLLLLGLPTTTLRVLVSVLVRIGGQHIGALIQILKSVQQSPFTSTPKPCLKNSPGKIPEYVKSTFLITDK
jgi:hypothetical protein